jgi:hypothetical protein
MLIWEKLNKKVMEKIHNYDTHNLYSSPKTFIIIIIIIIIKKH